MFQVEPIRFDVDKMQTLSKLKDALPSILHFAISTREKTDSSNKQDSSLSKNNCDILGLFCPEIHIN